MQIKHLKKNIHLLYFLLLSITAHSQNQYNVLREEAVHYMNLNDANQAIQSLTKIVQLYEKSPESILDIFLWRAKLGFRGMHQNLLSQVACVNIQFPASSRRYKYLLIV